MAHRLFYIPTNRSCANSIVQYGFEADDLKKRTGDKVLFAIIESGRGSSSKANSAALKSISPKLDVDSIHFTYKDQLEFFGELLRKCSFPSKIKNRLLDLLMPNGVAYSAGPNKAALLISSLDGSVMHRRDSDTQPLDLNRRKLYASEIEAMLLGKTLAQVSHVFHSEFIKPEHTVFFVGSDYQGALPVDRTELADLSIDLLIDHTRLEDPNSSSDELAEDVKRRFVDQSASKYEHDIIELDNTGQTELGVSAVYRLFQFLPEMPVKDTLGCDYMQKNLLYRIDSPVVYHNRRVHHEYTKERDTVSNTKEFIRYNLMDARYKLLWRIWSKHNRNLEKNIDQLVIPSTSLDLNVDFYSSSFESASADVSKDELKSILVELSGIYERAYKLSDKNKYLLLSEEINEKMDFLIDDVRRGVHDYCFLISHWSTLLDRTRELGRQLLRQPI